jgi:hypothetical protein
MINLSDLISKLLDGLTSIFTAFSLVLLAFKLIERFSPDRHAGSMYLTFSSDLFLFKFEVYDIKNTSTGLIQVALTCLSEISFEFFCLRLINLIILA